MNLKTILVGLIGLAIGAYANYAINQKTNKELLASLKAELDTLQLKANTTGRLSEEEALQMNILKAQIDILSKK